jgi:flagellar motor switch protein FliN/FliY
MSANFPHDSSDPTPGIDDLPPLDDLSQDLSGDWPGDDSTQHAAQPEATASAPVPLAMRETLRRVPVKLTLEVGATRLTLGELAALRADDVLSLDRAAGAPLAVLVNGVPVGLAEVVASGTQYGLKILTLDALELDRLAR